MDNQLKERLIKGQLTEEGYSAFKSKNLVIHIILFTVFFCITVYRESDWYWWILSVVVGVCEFVNILAVWTDFGCERFLRKSTIDAIRGAQHIAEEPMSVPIETA